MRKAAYLSDEESEQIAVVEWCRYNEETFPALKLLHHCPNGGSRDEREAAKLKMMGVLPGVADLHLPAPKGVYGSLYIEMKCDGGRLEDSQKRFLTAAAEAGNFCAVCYCAEAAICVIRAYLKLKRGEEMCVPNLVILKKRRSKK